MSVCAAKAHNEQVGIVNITINGKVRHLDVCNLLCAQASHQVVVLRIGGYRTGIRVFLQTAEDMLESFATRHCPVACAVLGTHVWCPFALQFLRNIRWVNGIKFFYVRQFESSRTISSECIGEQHNGSHVLQCNLRCLVSGVEAVGRTYCCHHWHRTLAVTAE